MMKMCLLNRWKIGSKSFAGGERFTLTASEHLSRSELPYRAGTTGELYRPVRENVAASFFALVRGPRAPCLCLSDQAGQMRLGCLSPTSSLSNTELGF